MAGSARSAAAKHAYRMFAPPSMEVGGAEELDESDVWGSFGGACHSSAVSSDDLAGGAGWARPVHGPRAGRKKPVDGGGAVGSLPMNIPDWQKILGVEYRDHQHAGEWEADADGGGGGGSYGGAEMVPPHELAWRSRAASLSVHEGVGRTLKGRDLSRVRDAVWKRTGFED